MSAGEFRVTGVAQHQAWQARSFPAVEQVRPGLWSIPVPIPHSPLRYTLCYAFGDDHGVVLVDPGWDTADGRHALKTGLAVAGADVSDVTGVLVTHVHPDHHGLTGWLRGESGAWVGMHPLEARTLPVRVWRDRPPAADQAWLRRHGVPEAEIPVLAIDPGQIGDFFDMAEPDRLIEDGDRIALGGRELHAVWTPGHTPGHLCLHDSDAGVLLTGDHLLPRISPNIGVQGDDDGDPLTTYLASLDRTAQFRAEEALPAHEYRFRGVDRRATDLIAHHEHRNAEVLGVVDRLAEPSAWAIAAELTWSRGWPALHGMMRRMAMSETLAHLHHLVARGDLVTVADEPIRWRRRPGG